MSIINLLLDKGKWQEFLDHKLTKSHLSKYEEQSLIDFVNKEKYLSVSRLIIDGNYTFSVPKRVLINKSGTSKKRVIYTFEETENIILKFILFCMSEYDNVFYNNCFSFRKNLTIKHAFYKIINKKNISDFYAYKLDISNYFNSIDVQKLLPMLKDILQDDDKLFVFLKNILLCEKAIINDVEQEDKHGVMAGTPLSTFLANVYLRDLDEYFEKNNIHYARYSDDIIIFAEDEHTLKEYIQFIYTVIDKKGLVINNNKEKIFLPHKPWHFLGFEFYEGIIDLSDVTINKIKGKIRRKARALYRWKCKNNKTTEQAISVMLRVFNNKFYREKNTKDLTWSKWFFPVINTHKKLTIIDKYFIQYLRYLSSGKFSKINYRITYKYLKNLGFKSLVYEYYRYNKNKKSDTILGSD